MAHPGRQRDPEGRPPTNLALHVHAATVESSQLLDERQANPGALMCACPRAVDTMKAFEEPRQLHRGDTRPRISNFQHDAAPIVARTQRHADAAFERELER